MVETYLKPYEKLLKDSEIFFNSTRILIDNFGKEDDVFDLETIFFCLHQSAENILKSLLVYNKIKFTSIRDLNIIVCLIRSNNIDIIPEVDNITYLSSYSVYGRHTKIRHYLKDAEKYILLIGKLIKFVKKEETIKV